MTSSALCQQYIEMIYRDIKGHSNQHAANTSNIPITYGEILTPSVDDLINHLHLQANDVFYDLGSGTGKVVLQFFLQTVIQKAVGIEIMPDLYHKALAATQFAARDFPVSFDSSRKMQFILGDFLKEPLDAATILLIASPCYSPSMLDALAVLINNTPSIHTVLCLRPLIALTRLPFKQTIKIQGSWDSALCYLYTTSQR